MTVINVIINLCHLTVLYFVRRKLKIDLFQTNSYCTLVREIRVNQMSFLPSVNFILSLHNEQDFFWGEMSSARKNMLIRESYLQNAEFHIDRVIQTIAFLSCSQNTSIQYISQVGCLE